MGYSLGRKKLLGGNGIDLVVSSRKVEGSLIADSLIFKDSVIARIQEFRKNSEIFF